MSAPVEETKEKPKIQLTPAQWAEVVMLWELGETKLDELSAKFGISISGLSKGLKERGATRGSRAHEVAAAAKQAVLATKSEDAADNEKIRQDRIKDTRNQHYEWATMLARQVVTRLALAQKDGRDLSTETANVKALRQAIAVLEVARKERFAVLNADDDMGESELPTLPLEDLSDHEISEMQVADSNDDVILEDVAEDDVIELS